MDNKRLARLSATELARLVATKQLSPVEVTRAYLERIDRFDDKLSAYITVCREEALRAARDAEQAVVRGDQLGRLHGIPLAIKDQFETRGVRTTAGSKILADYFPEEDATVVNRAQQAGAILLGKLNMTEFAAGLGDRYKYGEPKNPWDLERSAGGSSTGSAIAIAAALCALSLGEDTGGSIRFPAALTGIVGVRPSWGRVSRHGVVPVSWSMDTAGPMTRTVEDAALLMTVISGHDQKDALTARLPVPDYTQALGRDLDGIRIGLLQELMDEEFTYAEVLQAIKEATMQLERLGARVELVSLPPLKTIGPIMTVISGSDGAFVVRKWLRTRPEDFGPALRRRWLVGSLIPAQVLHKAVRLRALFRREWLKLFERFDILLSPTHPTTAEKIAYHEDITTREEAERRLGGQRYYTVAPALAGTPAMSVPCGFDTQNLPIGLQIMAGPFQEELMFKVGYAYEQSTTWHSRNPPDATCT